MAGKKCDVRIRIGDEQIAHHENLEDPFVNSGLQMGWKDRIRFLFSDGRVSFVVNGNKEALYSYFNGPVPEDSEMVESYEVGNDTSSKVG